MKPPAALASQFHVGCTKVLMISRMSIIFVLLLRKLVVTQTGSCGIGRIVGVWGLKYDPLGSVKEPHGTPLSRCLQFKQTDQRQRVQAPKCQIHGPHSTYNICYTESPSRP